jgi:hypothetical protein
MMQPTKDELRTSIYTLRRERDSERAQRQVAEEKLANARQLLDEAARLLGYQFLEASIKGELPAPNMIRLLEHQS